MNISTLVNDDSCNFGKRRKRESKREREKKNTFTACVSCKWYTFQIHHMVWHKNKTAMTLTCIPCCLWWRAFTIQKAAKGDLIFITPDARCGSVSSISHGHYILALGKYLYVVHTCGRTCKPGNSDRTQMTINLLKKHRIKKQKEILLVHWQKKAPKSHFLNFNVYFICNVHVIAQRCKNSYI